MISDLLIDDKFANNVADDEKTVEQWFILSILHHSDTLPKEVIDLIYNFSNKNLNAQLITYFSLKYYDEFPDVVKNLPYNLCESKDSAEGVLEFLSFSYHLLFGNEFSPAGKNLRNNLLVHLAESGHVNDKLIKRLEWRQEKIPIEVIEKINRILSK